MLVDTYPITARARVFAMLGGAQAVGTMAAPFLAGGIAALAGGDNGWRWAFLLLGVVAFPIALSANTIKEPRRGRHEMQSVLGEELPPEEHELPISLSVAFERLRKIQSFYYFLVGMAALGFALFTAPLFLNLYFDEELGLDAFQRGIVATIIAIPTFIAIAIAGRRADRAVPSQPARGDGVRRPARRAVRHRTGHRDLAAEHLGGRPRARGRDGLRARPRSRSFPRSSRRSSPTGCARAARR